MAAQGVEETGRLVFGSHPGHHAYVSLTITLATFAALSAVAQVKGPVAPAVTAEQIKTSESLTPKFDESAAREKARLATFANRPLGGVIQRSFNVFANYLVMAAEMMPEASYGFRPTPDVRTFGEQINHAAGAHYSFCNQAGLPPGVQKQAARSEDGHRKAGDYRRVERIDRLLRSRPRRGDGIVADGNRAWPRRLIERPRHRHTRGQLYLRHGPQRGRLRDHHHLSAHAGGRSAVDRAPTHRSSR